jgi:SIR2-like domain
VSPRLDAHYRMVLRALADGRVVPLLGAGVNRCGRADGVGWNPGRYAPDGTELARHLARYAAYPEQSPADLVRVSQYVAVMLGSGPLYEELRELFDVDYPPTPIHRFLATLPGELRARGLQPRNQLVITTNYDDALERAFTDAGEPFDLVTYVAVGEHAGSFLHYPPDAEPVLIEIPNEYRALSLDRRTVILKLHGAVDRENPERDSYVITEDHYIDYLTRTELAGLLPVTLAAKLRRSHFLFLGYSLRDWNLRVILHRIWGEQRLRYRSWAVQLDPEEIDCRFWEAREVDIFDVELEEYVDALTALLHDLTPAGVA